MWNFPFFSGLPPTEVSIQEVSKNSDHFCFLWKTIGSFAGIVNKLQVVMIQDNTFLRESKSSDVSLGSSQVIFFFKYQILRHYLYLFGQYLIFYATNERNASSIERERKFCSKKIKLKTNL